MPDARIEMIPNATHLMFEQGPQRFARSCWHFQGAVVRPARTFGLLHLSNCNQKEVLVICPVRMPDLTGAD
jgi:hypothetical protein